MREFLTGINSADWSDDEFFERAGELSLKEQDPDLPPPSKTLKIYCSRVEEKRPLAYFRNLAIQKYGLQASAKPIEVRFFDEGVIGSILR